MRADVIPLHPEVHDGDLAHRDRPGAGLTVADVAKRYRVSPDKVRLWIARGELKAINTADVLCAKPRWIVTREGLEEFEKARRGGPAPKQQRRRRQTALVDYFP